MVRTFAVTSSPRAPSPARRAAYEPAALVDQADRDSVDLHLAGVLDRRLSALVRAALLRAAALPCAAALLRAALLRAAALPRAQPLTDPPVERADLAAVEGVGEREHRDAVDHLGERRGRRGPHPLRRRVGGDEAGVLLLQRHQLAHEGVVLVVRDLRIVEDVVAVVVAADPFSKIPMTRFGVTRNERSG